MYKSWGIIESKEKVSSAICKINSTTFLHKIPPKRCHLAFNHLGSRLSYMSKDHLTWKKTTFHSQKSPCLCLTSLKHGKKRRNQGSRRRSEISLFNNSEEPRQTSYYKARIWMCHPDKLTYQTWSLLWCHKNHQWFVLCRCLSSISYSLMINACPVVWQ